MKIANIKTRPGFLLLVEADTGSSGIFDVRPYLEFDAFRLLKDTDEFDKIHNGGYFIEWNCGADLSADTIFSKWQVSDSRAQH